MSPEREIDETKGGKPDEKIVEQAAEAKAEQEAKTPRRRRRRKAEDTEVAAAAEEQAKPRRSRRRRKAEDEASGVGRQASEAEAEEPEEDERGRGHRRGRPDARNPTPDARGRGRPDARNPSRRPRTSAQRPTPNARRPTPSAVRAHARYVRTSARKARLVCDHIRGKSVPEARAILGFTPRAAARDWSKVLESAVANAEANHELIGDELKVAEVYADEGPTLKRYRPRAMGRATRIRKRTSHLTITLAPAANESKERSR